MGEYIPFIFVAYLFIAMGVSALRAGEMGGFFKIFILPILAIMVIGFLFSQCSDGSKSKHNSKSFWGNKSNACSQGAWFDNFKDGRGQWRNSDGKFCSK
jgi:hypothetical protein